MYYSLSLMRVCVIVAIEIASLCTSPLLRKPKLLIFVKRYRYIVILSVVVILKEPIEESIGSLVYKIIQQVVLNSV